MKRPAIYLLAIALVLLAAAPASAAIRITKINFNPDGRDTGANEHVNREWVVLRNTGDSRRRLDGWKLNDEGRDHVYLFGDTDGRPDAFTNIVLRPDDFVMIRTGRGEDQATGTCSETCNEVDYFFFWDLDNYVWNNDGDRATLRNDNGRVVDRCSYSSTASSPTRC